VLIVKLYIFPMLIYFSNEKKRIPFLTEKKSI
jgi:hypothetical protein